MDSTQNPLDDELARANLRTAITFAVCGVIVAALVFAYYLPIAQGRSIPSSWMLAPAGPALIAMMIASRRFDILTDLHARFEPGVDR